MKLTIEQRRDIFLAAVRIEETSIMASRTADGESSSKNYDEDRMTWKDWQIDFYGCIPCGERQTLVAHYMRPVSETRIPKGKTLTQSIRHVWREARKNKLIGYGLHISESIKV